MNIYALLRIDDSAWDSTFGQQYGVIRYRLTRDGEQLKWIVDYREDIKRYYQYSESFYKLKHYLNNDLKAYLVLPQIYIRQSPVESLPTFLYEEGDLDNLIRIEDM